jgi:hypothetical protein
MASQTKSNTNGKSNTIIETAGQTFSDGAALELVSNSTTHRFDLLLWDGRKGTISDSFERDGCTYHAPKSRQDFYRAIRLPARSTGYASARELFQEISGEFKRNLDVEERVSNLYASFSISSWAADLLPIVPSLCISGPDPQTGIEALRLLSCFCRHPLMLADVTPAVLRSLPMQLSLTLLIQQEELKPNLQRLFRSANYGGFFCVGSGGRIVDLSGPKAIFCGDGADLGSLGNGVIYVSATPSRSRSPALDEQALQKLASEFQPRLLAYRLKNHSRIHQVQKDFPELTPATQQLARALAACFPEDPDLGCEMVQLLKLQDEEVQGQSFYDVNYAITEVLLGLIHSGQQRGERVDELARNVNALLWSRGETLTYSAEEIGWTLRGLNIPRHSIASGRQVLLKQETRQIVHRLARFYGLACAEKDCPQCAEGEAIVNKQLV